MVFTSHFRDSWAFFRSEIEDSPSVTRGSRSFPDCYGPDIEPVDSQTVLPSEGVAGNTCWPSVRAFRSERRTCPSLALGTVPSRGLDHRTGSSHLGDIHFCCRSRFRSRFRWYSHFRSHSCSRSRFRFRFRFRSHWLPNSLLDSRHCSGYFPGLAGDMVGSENCFVLGY
jgi:hypothetical protein